MKTNDFIPTSPREATASQASDERLGAREAAAYLGCSKSQIYNLMHAGKLRGWHIAGSKRGWWFYKADLDVLQAGVE